MLERGAGEKEMKEKKKLKKKKKSQFQTSHIPTYIWMHLLAADFYTKKKKGVCEYAH